MFYVSTEDNVSVSYTDDQMYAHTNTVRPKPVPRTGLMDFLPNPVDRLTRTTKLLRYSSFVAGTGRSWSALDYGLDDVLPLGVDLAPQRCRGSFADDHA